MPRISGKLDFLAAAGAAAMFGMAGWAIAGGAKAWGEGAAGGAEGVAEFCPNVSWAGTENWRVYSPGPAGCGAAGAGVGIENPRVAPPIGGGSGCADVWGADKGCCAAGGLAAPPGDPATTGEWNMRVNSPGSGCGAAAGGGGGASVPLPNVRVNSLTGLKPGRPVACAKGCCTAGLCGIGPAGDGV
jgi:hypothetical protein